MDLRMPVMPGEEEARQIKALDKTRRTRLIAEVCIKNLSYKRLLQVLQEADAVSS